MSALAGPQADPRRSFRIPVTGSASRRLAMAVAVLFAVTTAFAYAAPSRTLAWSDDSFSSSSESELIALTNRSRASAGLKALKVDSALTSVARWRSKDMIVRDYFSHDIPGYGKVFKKLQAIGYCYAVAGENIGVNNYPDDTATAAIHQAFMNSAGHKANILGTGYDHIGVGAYKGSDGRKMWTVLFADKCGSTPAATAKPKPKATAKPKAAATARPTPRSTTKPKPAPAATPAALDDPSVEPTGPRSSDDRIGPTDDAGAEPVDPGGAPSQDPGDDTSGDSAVGMRVVDPGATGGLLETIVGGVTGFFLGG